MTIIELASKFKWVRELTDRNNDGPMVEAFLRFVGLPKGNPWCAAFVSFVLAVFFEGKPPFPPTPSCQAIYDYAKKHGLIVDRPKSGYVFLIINGEGHAHHTGFCIDEDDEEKHFPTNEGNTNPAGGREGYGVFERVRVNGPHVVIVKTY